jgi:ParB family chromosome partitioning protein
MSVPKRRLGRGLDTLLGQPREAGSSVAALPIDAIRPNPQQPRITFDPAALAELEHSIRELGVLVPIIVRPLAGNEHLYELSAGERRWRAAAAAGLNAIPALIRTADDRSSLELAVVENLQRQDLDPLEEAMGFAHLLEQYDYTQDALAERLGKSRSAVTNALRLLALADPLKALLRSGAISVGHAKALLAIDPARRESLAERIVRDGLSVRDVENAAAAATPKPRGARAPKRRSPDIEAVESRLRYALGSHVTILAARKGGRVEIRYSDDADLTRIADILLASEP